MKYALVGMLAMIIASCSSKKSYRVRVSVICGNDVQHVIKIEELPKGFLSGDTVGNGFTSYFPDAQQVITTVIEPLEQ